MKNNIRLFLSGARASWATYMVDLTPTVFLGMHIPRTILQSLFFVYLAKAAGGDDLARFALIGNAIQIAVFNVMLAMEEVIESEKWNNTFQYLIAAPSSWFPSMVGKSMAHYGDAILATVISFAALIPLLKIEISLANLLHSVPVILLVIFSATTLGWSIGAFSLPIRYGFLICNWFAYAMIVLCGVNVPVSALPPAVQFFSNILPVTHGLQAIRALIDGATYSNVFPLIGAEVLIALAYGSIAWLMFGYRMKVTRQKGTFELV